MTLGSHPMGKQSVVGFLTSVHTDRTHVLLGLGPLSKPAAARCAQATLIHALHDHPR